MLDQLYDLCENCSLCSLGKARPVVKGNILNPHVFSNMNPSRFVVIGQNPGYVECLRGQPFLGRAGQNFNDEIAKHGLSRNDFYITNILHCYTPGNRSPNRSELAACRPLIKMELQYLKPRLIVTLGKFAFKALCPSCNYSESLGTIQVSSVFEGLDCIFPIYHPSGQNLAIKVRRAKFEADIERLALYVKEARK